MLQNKRLTAKIVNGEDVIMNIDENLLSAEFGALDRGNITDVVNWGIYANIGSISFIDNKRIFNNNNINSTDALSYKIKFFLKDRTNENLIATFNIQNIEFDDESKTVEINLISNLVNWQEENTSKVVYPFWSTTAEDLLEKINNASNYTKVVLGEDVDNLSKISIGCPYVGIDSFWNIITKICQCSMSRILEEADGTAKISASFPVKKPIIVNPQNIVSYSNNGFVKIKNPSINMTMRKRIVGQFVDESKANFSINWEDLSTNILSTEGIINFAKTTETDYYNVSNVYGSGKIKIKTPYKIFSLGEDESIYNKKFTSYSLDGTDQRREQYTTVTGEPLSNKKVENETDIYADFPKQLIGHQQTEAEVGTVLNVLTSGLIKVEITSFQDTGTSILSLYDSIASDETIPSNDLIQNISYYLLDSGGEIALAKHIIDDVNKRYSQGIEFFEMECLFNNYYDEDGNKVFDREDLSKHFQRYDVIIPYVKRKGQTVPLRSNEDGTPKKFRIIGISYYYDGLLKQRLQLHEERYDVD